MSISRRKIICQGSMFYSHTVSKWPLTYCYCKSNDCPAISHPEAFLSDTPLERRENTSQDRDCLRPLPSAVCMSKATVVSSIKNWNGMWKKRACVHVCTGVDVQATCSTIFVMILSFQCLYCSKLLLRIQLFHCSQKTTSNSKAV